jgi:precorrin-2 dehydrogenase/sirohydrochlorin ferrochelatase
MNKLFPIFVKLENRLVVVVGGGSVAESKIASLLAADARVCVVSPRVTPTIAKWAEQTKVVWLQRGFGPGDLRRAYLVIAATAAKGVNEAVFREAEERGILCNAVDDIANCHFYFGSVVQRGDLQIAISTNGKSPALAQRLRKELELQFGPEYEMWLEWLGSAREALRASSDKAHSNRAESNKVALHCFASRAAFEEFMVETRRDRSSANRGAA